MSPTRPLRVMDQFSAFRSRSSILFFASFSPGRDLFTTPHMTYLPRISLKYPSRKDSTIFKPLRQSAAPPPPRQKVQFLQPLLVNEVFDGVTIPVRRPVSPRDGPLSCSLPIRYQRRSMLL